ncbi:mucin-5AC-like [Hippoglossus stenolepis]|uniref:mucin-5AC-like n=1 Tax=Hippoglossus stenolepis TaxID=195615 RepID=UPI001FAEEAEF|nr:mucin-5AC-like [Hippoglossus stenolepis]
MATILRTRNNRGNYSYAIMATQLQLRCNCSTDSYNRGNDSYNCAPTATTGRNQLQLPGTDSYNRGTGQLQWRQLQLAEPPTTTATPAPTTTTTTTAATTTTTPATTITTTAAPTATTAAPTVTTAVPTATTAAPTATSAAPTATTAAPTATTAAPTATTTAPTATTAVPTATTAATTTTTVAPQPTYTVSVGLTDEPFTDELKNPESSQYKDLEQKLVGPCNTIYKNKFGNKFDKCSVKEFRQPLTRANGVVADLNIAFSTNSTTSELPENGAVAETLVSAVNNSNSPFNVTIDSSTITLIAAQTTTAPTTAAPTTAAPTTAAPTTAAPTTAAPTTPAPTTAAPTTAAPTTAAPTTAAPTTAAPTTAAPTTAAPTTAAPTTAAPTTAAPTTAAPTTAAPTTAAPTTAAPTTAAPTTAAPTTAAPTTAAPTTAAPTTAAPTPTTNTTPTPTTTTTPTPTTCNTIYKNKFGNKFDKCSVKEFRNGSIFNTLVLVFSGAVPNNTAIADVLLNAASSVTSFNIEASSITVDGIASSVNGFDIEGSSITVDGIVSCLSVTRITQAFAHLVYFTSVSSRCRILTMMIPQEVRTQHPRDRSILRIVVAGAFAERTRRVSHGEADSSSLSFNIAASCQFQAGLLLGSVTQRFK